MMLISVAALVAALGMVVLVAVLVSAINELKKTTITVREFIVNTETTLQPLLTELKETVADVRTITHTAAVRRDDVTSLMTALGDTGESVHRLNEIVGGAVQLIEKPVIYWTGLKAVTQNILGRFTQKRG